MGKVNRKKKLDELPSPYVYPLIVPNAKSEVIKISQDLLLNIVLSESGLTIKDICRHTRKTEIIIVRHALMYFKRKYEGSTYKSLAKMFKKEGLVFNHTTIMHACRSIEELFLPINANSENPKTRAAIEFLRRCEKRIIQYKVDNNG